MKRYRELKRALAALKKKYSKLEFTAFGGLLKIEAEVAWDCSDFWYNSTSAGWALSYDYNLLEDNSEGLLEASGLEDLQGDIVPYLDELPDLIQFQHDLSQEVKKLILSPEDLAIVEHLADGGTEDQWREDQAGKERDSKNEVEKRRALYEELKKEFDK